MVRGFLEEIIFLSSDVCECLFGTGSSVPHGGCVYDGQGSYCNLRIFSDIDADGPQKMRDQYAADLRVSKVYVGETGPPDPVTCVTNVCKAGIVCLQCKN